MPDPAPPPIPALSPQAFRIVLLGSTLFVVVLGVDAAMILTGHGSSPVATLTTKLLAAVVGIATSVLAARAPGPGQAALEARLAAAERRQG